MSAHTQDGGKGSLCSPPHLRSGVPPAPLRAWGTLVLRARFPPSSPEFHSSPRGVYHVCKAFLRAESHFDLRLKTFGIKPKISSADLAECGGAIISKIQKVDWFEGTFIETMKEWQREWFYITKPLAGGQANVPVFFAAPPRRLVSWMRKGLDLG